MQVAVFDTYVRKPDGATAHFDIIVPRGTGEAQVMAFGKKYLETQAPGALISARECQFCHIEEPSEEVVAAIGAQGFYILEFNDIPAALPGQPTRRQLIEHIRAQSEALRFSDFRGVGEEKLREIVRGLF